MKYIEAVVGFMEDAPSFKVLAAPLVEVQEKGTLLEFCWVYTLVGIVRQAKCPPFLISVQFSALTSLPSLLLDV